MFLENKHLEESIVLFPLLRKQNSLMFHEARTLNLLIKESNYIYTASVVRNHMRKEIVYGFLRVYAVFLFVCLCVS